MAAHPSVAPRLRVLAAALNVWLAAAGAEGAVLLYQNDFENPSGFVDTTGVDVSQQQVNDLYGQAGFSYQQINTVETLELKGGVAFGTGYSDPQGIGGNYALGMLSSVQDDAWSLTFDVDGLRYLNLGMDVSAIDLDGVGGPFGVAQPVFRISLYDSPGGLFDVFNPGTPLAQVEVAGTDTPSASVLDWTAVVAALDASGSQDGHVSVVVDLLESGYAAMDNLRVVASDTPGDVPEPSASLLAALALTALAGLRRGLG